MDALQAQLAARTRSRIGDADDFQIIVTEAEYPIGTLMRQGRTIPVNYSACLPTGAPPTAPTPSLFPAYSLSRTAAADFGLDAGVIDQIGEAGVNVSDARAVKLAFKDTGVSVLSDADMKQILETPQCAASMGDAALWLVRGYIRGQRRFSLTSQLASTVKVKASKIANFSVNPGSGDSSVEVMDEAPVGFLQIVSEVHALLVPAPIPPDRPTHPTIRPIPGPPGPPQVAPAVEVAKPTAGEKPGRVYVQRDVADASGREVGVVRALRAADFTVDPRVERIETAKTPKTAQVRYFNLGDKGRAEAALAALKTLYPSAGLTRIALPAPAGQLEVWLPRAG